MWSDIEAVDERRAAADSGGIQKKMSACMQQVYSNISKGTTTTSPLPQAKAPEASRVAD